MEDEAHLKAGQGTLDFWCARNLAFLCSIVVLLASPLALLILAGILRALLHVFSINWRFLTDWRLLGSSFFSLGLVVFGVILLVQYFGIYIPDA